MNNFHCCWIIFINFTQIKANTPQTRLHICFIKIIINFKFFWIANFNNLKKKNSGFLSSNSTSSSFIQMAPHQQGVHGDVTLCFSLYTRPFLQDLLHSNTRYLHSCAVWFIDIDVDTNVVWVWEPLGLPDVAVTVDGYLMLLLCVGKFSQFWDCDCA